MTERLRKPPRRLSEHLGSAASRWFNHEAVGVMKFYAPIQEDLSKEAGEPTRAEKLESDVLVLRVGARHMTKKGIGLASKAMRDAARSTSDTK